VVILSDVVNDLWDVQRILREFRLLGHESLSIHTAACGSCLWSWLKGWIWPRLPWGRTG
jgi:hypothetical protein